MTSDLHRIDVASSPINHSLCLDRVGMSRIEAVVLVPISGTLTPSGAHVDAYVSLDQPQKGIHMSRLFIAVQESLAKEALSPKLLCDLTQKFLSSHAGSTHNAHIGVRFNLMLQRPALLSKNSGWRNYPIHLWATRTSSGVKYGADLTITYSSTCPCSAALARQLNQKRFASRFSSKDTVSKDEIFQWLGSEDAMAGTPHGQRSEGKVRAELRAPTNDLSAVVRMIESLESALTTPVQAAVKREDEQEFARLNAANLMFAEDAVRRMHDALTSLDLFNGFAVEAVHLESLHAHDAVARVAIGSMSGHSWH